MHTGHYMVLLPNPIENQNDNQTAMVGDLPSELLEQAVQQMNTLPGVGRKTALRLVLQLLRRDESEVEAFANSFLRLKKNIRYCRYCHN